ncbi:MAG: hypothetical protein ACE5O2_14045, partial [Armatimonadota bacterium]
LRLIESPSELARVEGKARQIIAENRGAARRCAEAISDALSPTWQAGSSAGDGADEGRAPSATEPSAVAAEATPNP